MKQTDKTATEKVFPTGALVEIFTAERANPILGHVGEVSGVSPEGLKITPMDWVSATCWGVDLFIPWGHIVAVSVAETDDTKLMLVEDFSDREAGSGQPQK